VGDIMHGNLEPEESVWETYTVHPEMADVNLETEELLSVTFEDKPKVDMVFTPDESFKDKIRDYFNFDDFDGDIVIRT